MPVVLRVHGYKFFFYEADLANEPPHVHVTKEGIEAKKELEALQKQISKDFGDPDEEYNNVHQIIKWNGDKRSLSLKGMDGASTLSVVLTSMVKK